MAKKLGLEQLKEKISSIDTHIARLEFDGPCPSIEPIVARMEANQAQLKAQYEHRSTKAAGVIQSAINKAPAQTTRGEYLSTDAVAVRNAVAKTASPGLRGQTVIDIGKQKAFAALQSFIGRSKPRKPILSQTFEEAKERTRVQTEYDRER